MFQQILEAFHCLHYHHAYDVVPLENFAFDLNSKLRSKLKAKSLTISVNVHMHALFENKVQMNI
jgi:hypothetical protein